MAAMGHEDAFPTTTLSIRSRLGKPTFAGTRGNEQDAPILVIPVGKRSNCRVRPMAYLLPD
jgi:hypothetical protein